MTERATLEWDERKQEYRGQCPVCSDAIVIDKQQVERLQIGLSVTVACQCGEKSFNLGKHLDN